jgi:arginyl-tRNA synthetase
VVGLGAVKYADVRQDRTSDYEFAWNKLLALDGNTAPYLLYAVARIHSIFRKIGVPVDDAAREALADGFATPTEISLARKLVALPSVLDATLADLRPHFLSTYLYELAGEFSAFYNADRVMVDEKQVQARRLLLCARTLRVLETGLRLLGLETLERM